MSSLVREYVEDYAKGYAERLLRKRQKAIAERMIAGGELTFEKIAKYTDLSLSAVERLAKDLEDSHA